MHDETTLARFWAKVDKDGPNGCWEWTGASNGSGYGQIRIGSRQPGVHRVSYEVAKGPIPDGMQIDHLCRNKRCVNPAHLEAVTPRANTMRADNAPATINAKKTHCPQGHPYSGPSLYVSRSGKRYCLICIRENKRKQRLRAGAVPRVFKNPR